MVRKSAYLDEDNRRRICRGNAERYLRLEQARFRDSLQVSIEIAPETLSAVVPAMSLQPLVENAVRHGVERRAGSGKVMLSAQLEGDDVQFRVSDDGAVELHLPAAKG